MPASYSSRSTSSRVSFESNRRMSSSRVINELGSSSVGYDPYTPKSVMPAYEVAVYGNEKLDMQNLNERLASYMEKVRSLEQANSKLELQIKTFYESKLPMHSKDYSGYFQTISDLRTQIQKGTVENAKLILKVDNARLAAEDFKIKYENEMAWRMTIEGDLSRLRNVLGEIKLSSENLKIQHTGLNEELVLLKKNHEEDLLLLREQQSGAVNVEVDCAAHTDLDKILREMREQYETLIEKTRKESEQWYKSKVTKLQSEVTSSVTEIKTSETEITNLRRTLQSLEIELKGLLTLKQQLEQNLSEIGIRFSSQLNGLQLKIDFLEEEMRVLTSDIQAQASEYELLLNIKMRLEMEIVEYRRLLEGEAQTYEKTAASTSLVNGFTRPSAVSNVFSESSSNGTVNSTESTMIATETKSVTKTIEEEVTTTIEIKEEIKEEEVTTTIEIKEEEVHNPHIQRRVKTIVEEIVDGKVVRTVVDEDIQDLN